MCPHDWGKKIILGNLNNTNLLDIWFSKKSMQIRKLLNNSNRNFTPCNICDVEGTFMGKKRMQHILNNEKKVLIIGGSSDIGIQLVKKFLLKGSYIKFFCIIILILKQ